MSDLQEIIKKTNEINENFSEALEIFQELFKDGVKPSEESIKEAVKIVLSQSDLVSNESLRAKLNELLQSFNDEIDDNLKPLVESILKELNIQSGLNESELNKFLDTKNFIDETKANELIDAKSFLDENALNEKLNAKNYLTNESLENALQNKDFVGSSEVENKINETLANLNLEGKGINIAEKQNAPTILTQGQAGDMQVVFNPFSVWLCVGSEDNNILNEKLYKWADLYNKKYDFTEVANGFKRVINITLSIDTTKGSNSYGGNVSDLRIAFNDTSTQTKNGPVSEYPFASCYEVVDGIQSGEFLLTKDGLGFATDNAKVKSVTALSNPQDNQIKGTITTTDEYNAASHYITQLFKKYVSSYVECNLWATQGIKTITLQLESEEMPTAIFLRGKGYYGSGAEVISVEAKKELINSKGEILNTYATWQGEKKEADVNLYGDNANLFTFREPFIENNPILKPNS